MINCNTPNAHVALFVYFLIEVLIKTDKPDYWAITAVQKNKALSMGTRYNIGKHYKKTCI